MKEEAKQALAVALAPGRVMSQKSVSAAVAISGADEGSEFCRCYGTAELHGSSDAADPRCTAFDSNPVLHALSRASGQSCNAKSCFTPVAMAELLRVSLQHLCGSVSSTGGSELAQSLSDTLECASLSSGQLVWMLRSSDDATTASNAALLAVSPDSNAGIVAVCTSSSEDSRGFCERLLENTQGIIFCTRRAAVSRGAPWVSAIRPLKDDPLVTLFLLHCAGESKEPSFSDFSHLSPGFVQPKLVRLPGSVGRVNVLASAMARALASHLQDSIFCFFGYGHAAQLAHCLTLHLKELAEVEPLHIFLAGNTPPVGTAETDSTSTRSELAEDCAAHAFVEAIDQTSQAHNGSDADGPVSCLSAPLDLFYSEHTQSAAQIGAWKTTTRGSVSLWPCSSLDDDLFGESNHGRQKLVSIMARRIASDLTPKHTSWIT